MQIREVSHESGRRVLEKRAETSEEASRLRREADLLEVASHPGLVELIDFEDGPEPCLRTGFLEGGTLAEQGALELEEVAGVVAALASTVADLHSMGLVHGAVVPEHVLLDEEGRPVLCSVGYGGLAGERPSTRPALPPSFVDPSIAEDGALLPTADVFGLGAILHRLLSQVSGHPRRAPLDSLLGLAERATAATAADRPAARTVADAVHDGVLGARLPRNPAANGTSRVAPGPARSGQAEAGDERADVDGRERPLDRWRQAQVSPSAPRSRRPLVLAATVGAVIVAAALVVQARPGDRLAAPMPQEPVAAPLPADADPTTGSAGTSVDAAPAAGAVRPPGARSGCPVLEAVLSADVDGDGCAEAVRLSEGVLEAGSLRWAVGRSGDVGAIGDWSCGGTRSLALLRPATGEVFAFEGWATAGSELHAPLVGQVAGGRMLRAADLDGDGCHELVVERAAGAPTVLRVARSERP